MNKKTIYSPDAAAYIKGSSKYSNLHGVVTFKPVSYTHLAVYKRQVLF